MLTIRPVLALLALMFVSAAHAADSAPDALVRSTVDDVLSVIRQNPDPRVLHDLVEKKVLPHFDFRHMTQFAVGSAWRDANATQKTALENAFRSLLVSTYTAALARSAKNTLTVDVKPPPGKPGDNDVTVKTLVRDPGRQPVAINYRMAKGTSGWKVYDVVVENLSLVANYRVSFNTEISRSGIDGLIRVLEAKNRQLSES